MRTIKQIIEETSSDASVRPSTGSVEMFELRARNTQLIAIRNLRPTQMTVGYREVAEKRRRWRAGLATGDDAFHRLLVPVVIGPGGENYILDRHHALCALASDGGVNVQVSVVEDFRSFEWVGFWRTLDRRGWCRPRDAKGKRLDYSFIPTTIDGLADDPYRSLARALRRAGGYAKQKAPFSDFVWADYLRGRIPRALVDDDFPAALQAAQALAVTGGAITSPVLQSAKLDLHPSTKEPQSQSSDWQLSDAVSTNASRECTVSTQTGTLIRAGSFSTR
jgi:hypothetical protein